MIEKIKRLVKRIIRGNSLPCYIISRKPYIIISYWFDFVENLEAISAALPQGEKVYCLFQLGWQVESPKRIVSLRRDFNKVREKGLARHYTFMTNSKLISNICHKKAWRRF